MQCETCGGNSGVCDCFDPMNPYGAKLYRMKCSICGKIFMCAREKKGCSGTKLDEFRIYDRGCVGPCCSKPPYGNRGCWMGTPYFEDWEKGKLRRE